MYWGSGVVNSTVVTLMPKVLPSFWKFDIPDEVIELAFCDLMIVGRLCLANCLQHLKLMAAVLRCLKKNCLRRQST